MYCIYRNVIKSGKDEIWFDDVDPHDLEKVTGVKQKKLSEDDDVHTHTRNEIRQHEVTAQEPRYTDTTCRGAKTINF